MIVITEQGFTKKYWEARAEEQLTIASSMRYSPSRTCMIRLAEWSQKMADRIAPNKKGFDGKIADMPMERLLVDFYEVGLDWILENRPGGGWPPREVTKVAGWTVVRMLANMTGRNTHQVAIDLIDREKLRIK